MPILQACAWRNAEVRETCKSLLPPCVKDVAHTDAELQGCKESQAWPADTEDVGGREDCELIVVFMLAADQKLFRRMDTSLHLIQQVPSYSLEPHHMDQIIPQISQKLYVLYYSTLQHASLVTY